MSFHAVFVVVDYDSFARTSMFDMFFGREVHKIGVLRCCIIFSMSMSTNECFVNLSISLRSAFAPIVSGVLVILKMGGGLVSTRFFLLTFVPIAFCISELRVSGSR